MQLDDDARVILGWKAEVTADPTNATIELQIGDVRHPMAWEGPPAEQANSWTRDAYTLNMLAGTKRAAGGADIHLTQGRHRAQVILTMPDGQVLPSREFSIEVQ